MNNPDANEEKKKNTNQLELGVCFVVPLFFMGYESRYISVRLESNMDDYVHKFVVRLK